MLGGSSFQRRALYDMAGDVLKKAAREAPLQPLQPSPGLYPQTYLWDVLTRAIVLAGLRSRRILINSNPSPPSGDGHQQQVKVDDTT